MDKPGWEPKKLKKITGKGPLDRIKCLSEIYLDGATRGDTLPPILPQDLLHEINIIWYIPPFKKSILRRADNIISTFIMTGFYKTTIRAFIAALTLLTNY
jgi:hypothetical protein